MTRDEAIELGERAEALPQWAWPSGHLAVFEKGYLPGEGVDWFESESRTWPAGCIPDLRDPRAVGWLLWCVRRAWAAAKVDGRAASGEPLTTAHDSDDDCAWTVEQYDGRGGWMTLTSGGTEAEALVVALEQAP